MKTLAVLLALAALSSLVSAQLNLASADTIVPIDRTDAYDGLMIGTALGSPVSRFFDRSPTVVQRFRVDDSRAFTAGSVVEVYFRTLGGSSGDGPFKTGETFAPANAVPTGARVLLLATVARAGALRVIDYTGFDPRMDQSFSLDENARPSAFAWRWYPTTHTRLAPVADPEWRMLASVASAIPGTSDANACAISTFVARLPGRDLQRIFGTADDRLSKTFADTVAKDTPYHRALVDYALNTQGYWGYGDQFRVDMRAAADDPNAFPDGIPNLQFEENPGNNSDLPKDFRHTPPLTQPEVLVLLARAKSPAIAETYLGVLYEKPDDADIKALAARFLDAPDPRPRRAMVERLAAWNGLPAPEGVKERVDKAGVRRYEAPPGLDAAVAAWKRKLALP